MCICPRIVRPRSLEKPRKDHKKRTAFCDSPRSFYAWPTPYTLLRFGIYRAAPLHRPRLFSFPCAAFPAFFTSCRGFPCAFSLESRFPRFCLSRSCGMPFPPPFLLYRAFSPLFLIPNLSPALSHNLPAPFSPDSPLLISFSCQSKSFFSALRLSCSPGYRPPFLVISFFRSVSLSVFSILFFHHRLCPCFFLCPLLCPSRICPFCIIKKRHALPFAGHAVIFCLFLFFCLVFKDRLVAFRANQLFVSQHLFVKVYHFMAVRTFHFQKVAFVLVFVVLKQLVF